MRRAEVKLLTTNVYGVPTLRKRESTGRCRPNKECVMHSNTPSTQPWRRQKAQGREKEEQNQRQVEHCSNPRQSYQVERDHVPSGSGVQSSPMRQSRLKPPPGSAHSIHGIPIELISSPSRGLDANADASQNLTNAVTQQTFREHISGMIAQHVDRFDALLANADTLFPIICPTPRKEASQPAAIASDAAAGMNGESLRSLQDILLLVRRLREGCVASDRHDEFAREVYLLSTLLSILVSDNIQLGSSLSRFVRLLDEADSQQSCEDIGLLLSGSRNVSNYATIDRDQAHSLLLLWLSIYGGQAERLGGRQRQLHAGHSSLAFQIHRQSMKGLTGPHVRFAEACQKALGSDDGIAFRGLLIQARSNLWHTALLRRCVEEKRAGCWTTMKKAYIHLAIDGDLVDPPGTWPSPADPRDWLERMLLIDLELVPPTEQERAKFASVKMSSTLKTPEAWDDESIDDLAASLKDATLADSLQSLNIRSARLANALSLYGLPEAVEASKPASALDRWRGRLTTQAGMPVLKLR